MSQKYVDFADRVLEFDTCLFKDSPVFYIFGNCQNWEVKFKTITE